MNWLRRTRPGAIVSVLRNRRRWQQPIIHNRYYTSIPSWIAFPLLCGKVKGKLSCPPNLTIVIVHDRQEETILEKSLRFVGIKDFVLLRPENGLYTSFTCKIVELKKYLDSGKCPTEYILYIDSDDAVVRGDLNNAIRFLAEEDCDLLFSSTIAKLEFELTPDQKLWADQKAGEHSERVRYLNAGVFIGTSSFLQEVLGEALKYVTDDDLSHVERRRLYHNGTLLNVLPEFPKGSGCDQTIFRYLHPRFYPRMKTDFRSRLALR